VSDTSALTALEPAVVWERFAELTRIARPPKEEEAARQHVLAFAAARDLETSMDDEGNVVVRVPATASRDAAPTVVLQSHLDMVCERDPDSPYDPRQGRVNVVVDGDWVLAEGTTLGADNGIGVAAALAVADDPEIEHGPLELLFTVSEEQGLDGAKALDPALVSGRLLLNLDGTSDDAVTVGCAGSAHTFVRVQLELEPHRRDHVALQVVLSGAKGGHSGGDIASGRINAIKGLGRILARSYEQEPFRLARFTGGVSRNAIPREAQAVVSLEPDAEPAFRAAAEQELAALREQYRGFDDDVALAIEHVGEMDAAGESATALALDLVAAIPTGVVAMSPGLSGTVETSTSLTVATTESGTLTLASMTRSSNAAALEDTIAAIAAVARLAAADFEVVRSYPPWHPNLDSRLLATAKSTYGRLFGAEPTLAVVHGGLECAVIGEKLPGVEMISIGPEIVGPHAPGERVSITGTQRFYRLLGALLDDLSS
jgi:dipeptidase D